MRRIPRRTERPGSRFPKPGGRNGIEPPTSTSRPALPGPSRERPALPATPAPYRWQPRGAERDPGRFHSGHRSDQPVVQPGGRYIPVELFGGAARTTRPAARRLRCCSMATKLVGLHRPRPRIRPKRRARSPSQQRGRTRWHSWGSIRTVATIPSLSTRSSSVSRHKGIRLLCLQARPRRWCRPRFPCSQRESWLWPLRLPTWRTRA